MQKIAIAVGAILFGSTAAYAAGMAGCCCKDMMAKEAPAPAPTPAPAPAPAPTPHH